MTTATVNETDAGARLDVYAGALLGISVLMAACPSAMLVTALCLQYGRSDAFASKCIFLSTVLSAVTIPLLIWLLF